MTGNDIRYLFEPRCVAVIGASSDPKKIGYIIIDNIISSGYEGPVHPVNPKGGQILDRKVHTSISDIDGPVDLATITVPAQFVMDAVKDCARKGVKYISIITSGFSEIGNHEEEQALVHVARENGMHILGPNIFGIYSAKAKMNATFGPKGIMPGHVSIVTQSGALGIAMIGKTKSERIGLSSIVSMGNKCDVDEAEVLDYLIEDDDTKVILMYIEGIKDGEAFVHKLKEATKIKPIVVLKSGRSKRGAMAAASHTGSLAGADEVFSDVMRQCGVLRAESIQDALNWCKYLANSVPPKGNNCIIVTNGGGIGVLAADACEKYGVDLSDDIETMKATFADVVPCFGSVKNPVDITGGASLQDYESSLDVAIDNDNIDSIICLGCETATIASGSLDETIRRVYSRGKVEKPMVFSFFGGSEIEGNCEKLRSDGIPIYTDVYEAVSCLGALYNTWKHSSRKGNGTEDPGVDLVCVNKVIDEVLADGRNFLLAHEAKLVMDAAGIAMPKSFIAADLKQTIEAAEAIGYPVVMKIVSKDIVHKSDAGGVALDLQSRHEVMDAYEAIMHSCRRYAPKAKIEGVEVVEMVRMDVETIVGARIDPSFGPVVMFGLGGIYVEVMKDVSFRSYPIDRSEAMKMVSDIRSYPLLLGVRGEGKKDICKVLDCILKVGHLIKNVPTITDIEINPLVVYEEGDGARALDARILVSPKKEVSS